MIDLRPHRMWLALLAIAALIGVANAPVIGAAQTKEERKLAILRSDYDKTADTLRQLREDIATTEKLKTQIGEADAEKSLLPVDRLRAAQILERRAAESRLIRFSYTFAPEHKTPIETISAGPQNLATSQLTLTAEAPTDIDAYVFLDAVRHSLPGRLALRHISLEREGTADAPMTAANLRLTASGDWLSNGAIQNLAEQDK